MRARLLICAAALAAGSAGQAASSGAAALAAGSVALPEPLALWTFQEATGAPRISSGLHAIALVDGNASLPIAQAADGVWGPHSASFPATPGNNSQRLYAPRAAAAPLTSGIAGPAATVTMVAWVKRSGPTFEGMVAGVWDEYAAARQYAIFTDLGACSTAPVYAHGLAAHISNCGGPTPGQRYCVTRACDPEALPVGAWHCLANVYDGANITAYLNGTLHSNGDANPFAYPGGIYSPEAAGRAGAEFGVGANYVNKTAGAPPVLSNQFLGLLGGLAVFSQPLTQAQVAQVCASAPGFR
jgi:hypothetical protein